MKKSAQELDLEFIRMVQKLHDSHVSQWKLATRKKRKAPKRSNLARPSFLDYICKRYG